MELSRDNLTFLTQRFPKLFAPASQEVSEGASEDLVDDTHLENTPLKKPEPRYILYPEGFLTVFMPLIKMKPVRLLPLYADKDVKTHIIEIQLPRKDINPEHVKLLMQPNMQPVPIWKQTSALEDGTPKVRFCFHESDYKELNLEDNQHMIVYYVDANPNLTYEATYEIRLRNRTSSMNPNVAEIASLTCTLHFTNANDKKIGPGKFSLMIQQTSSSLRKQNSDAYFLRQFFTRPSLKNISNNVPGALLGMVLPQAQQQEQQEQYQEPYQERYYFKRGSAARMATPESFMEEKKRSLVSSESTSSGSQVAEGYLLHLPGTVVFEKSSSTQIPILELKNIPVQKLHSITLLTNEKNKGYADVIYKFRIPNQKGLKITTFPTGSITLYSETLQLLGIHHLHAFTIDSDQRLRGTKDQRVPYEATVSLERVQLDKKGNQAVIYSGGVTIWNKSFTDSKVPLLIKVYLPVEKPRIVCKKQEGIVKWQFQPQDMRIQLWMKPIPFNTSLHAYFTFIATDAIMIDNPNRIHVDLT